jgi:hypothetical protein
MAAQIKAELKTRPCGAEGTAKTRRRKGICKAKQDFRKAAAGFRTKILLKHREPSKHSLVCQRMLA